MSKSAQNYTIDLPELDFELDNQALPIQFNIAGASPTFTVELRFKFSFGFDEDNGFFVYTHPDDELSELFIKADLNMTGLNVDSRLLYFLGLKMNGLDIALGAGIFVDINKMTALRLKGPEEPSVNKGRLTLDMIRQLASKRDMFQICAIAAAGVTVQEGIVELDVPIVEFEEIKPWIPRITIAENNSVSPAVEAIVKKEKNIASTSNKKGRSLLEKDRRRLEKSISPSDHRGLRMLCSKEKAIDLVINCDVNITAGEFACARLNDIVLDVSIGIFV